jgi:peptidyl-prolyl cis-trans isomerase C
VDDAAPSNSRRSFTLLRWLREPLVLFLLLGGLLFATHALFERSRAPTVRLSADTRAALQADFAAVAGRPPDAAEIARLEHEYVVDEVLLQEAVERGLHLSSGAVRSRLVEDMRREIAGPLPDPTDEELVDYYSEHLDQYRSEPSASFDHVYFRERPDDAPARLAQLQQGTTLAGDPFARGMSFERYGRSMLRGMFGQAFVDALWNAPVGVWSGPVESAYGWHFVRPRDRQPAALLPFDAVRHQVEGDYLAAAIERAVDRHVARIEEERGLRIER